MKKSIRFFVGAFCALSLLVTPLAGCGEEKLPPMDSTHVEELNQSVAITKDWAGSYGIKETSVTHQTAGGSSITQNAFAELTYNADTHAFYYENDVSEIYPSYPHFTMYTQPNSDGSFTQYVKSGTQSLVNSYTNETQLKANGQLGKHLVTGEMIVIHFTSLNEAIKTFYLVDLDKANGITDVASYAEYWATTYKVLAEQQAKQFGFTCSFESGSTGAKIEEDKSIFSFEVNGTTTGEGSFSGSPLTNYSIHMTVSVTIANGRVTTLGCNVHQEFKLNGFKYKVDSTVTDEIFYEFNSSLIPTAEELAAW